jgi:hypothetical protein
MVLPATATPVADEALSPTDRVARDRLLAALRARTTKASVAVEHYRSCYVVTLSGKRDRGIHSAALTACASADTIGEALSEVAGQIGVTL